MKKFIFNLVAGAIVAAFIPGYSAAQSIKNASYPDEEKEKISIITDEGNYQPSFVRVETTTKTKLKSLKKDMKIARANFKAATDFSKSYPNVTEVTWLAEPNAIIASYNNDNLWCRVVYNKIGNRVYSIANYLEQDLPADIRTHVKNSFKCFNINLVQEIEQDDKKFYLIHLADDTTVKQVVFYKGEFSLYKEFTKSK